MYFADNKDSVFGRLGHIDVSIGHVDSLAPAAVDTFVTANIFLRKIRMLNKLSLKKMEKNASLIIYIYGLACGCPNVTLVSEKEKNNKIVFT